MNNLQETKEESKEKEHPIEVLVNRKPVTFKVRKASGEAIKATAIAQGVNIQQDFNLFEKKGEAHGEHWVPVPDDKVVNLHPKQEFRAVAPDDTSMY